LAVDDDPSLLALLVIYLRELGCEVISASPPIQGLALIHEAELDVLVSDINMPEIDGFELPDGA
jgi:CheY-like chemotaxis protein